MKILDDWKVYSGVSDLKQHAEGISVSQVIINSNYSDDHDDYDIALMKLSRPLTLSGEVSKPGWGWCLGAQREPGCSPATGLMTTAAVLLLGDSFLSPRLLFIMSPSSSGSPSLPPHVRPAVPDWQVLLHHWFWENKGK